MIRVLLVDDSPMTLHVLQKLLARSPDVEVVGTAADGRKALDLLPTLNPDVICTDMHMPEMGGLDLIRTVMATKPCPILVVSVSVEPDSPNVFSALEAGAVDVYLKPRDILGADQDKLAVELASKIRIVAGVHVFRLRGAVTLATRRLPLVLAKHAPIRIVVVGASTGGPQAIRSILSGLSSSFPVPVVCVQHIGEEFMSPLVAWLAEISPLPVRKATQGGVPQNGVVYFAPENAHLEFDHLGRFALSDAPPCSGHRPSATVTMRSAARRFGARTVGVLLTGMGRDGAEGMADIASAGGITIAQDEATSVVYGMPKEALELGAVQHVLAIEQIAPALASLWESHNGVSPTLRGEDLK